MSNVYHDPTAVLAANAKMLDNQVAQPTNSAQLYLSIAGQTLELKQGFTYILGSAPEAHVYIGGTDVAPQHAKISHDQLMPMQGALPTLLNGQMVRNGIAAPLRPALAGALDLRAFFGCCCFPSWPFSAVNQVRAASFHLRRDRYRLSADSRHSSSKLQVLLHTRTKHLAAAAATVRVES